MWSGIHRRGSRRTQRTKLVAFASRKEKTPQTTDGFVSPTIRGFVAPPLIVSPRNVYGEFPSRRRGWNSCLLFWDRFPEPCLPRPDSVPAVPSCVAVIGIAQPHYMPATGAASRRGNRSRFSRRLPCMAKVWEGNDAPVPPQFRPFLPRERAIYRDQGDATEKHWSAARHRNYILSATQSLPATSTYCTPRYTIHFVSDDTADGRSLYSLLTTTNAYSLTDRSPLRRRWELGS